MQLKGTTIIADGMIKKRDRQKENKEQTLNEVFWLNMSWVTHLGPADMGWTKSAAAGRSSPFHSLAPDAVQCLSLLWAAEAHRTLWWAESQTTLRRGPQHSLGPLVASRCTEHKIPVLPCTTLTCLSSVEEEPQLHFGWFTSLGGRNTTKMICSYWTSMQYDGQYKYLY